MAIKMDLKGTRFENLVCIHLGEKRTQWQSFVDMVMNLPLKAMNFWIPERLLASPERPTSMA
jgi:hypothetical protein